MSGDIRKHFNMPQLLSVHKHCYSTWHNNISPIITMTVVLTAMLAWSQHPHWLRIVLRNGRNCFENMKFWGWYISCLRCGHFFVPTKMNEFDSKEEASIVGFNAKDQTSVLGVILTCVAALADLEFLKRWLNMQLLSLLHHMKVNIWLRDIYKNFIKVIHTKYVLEHV